MSLNGIAVNPVTSLPVWNTGESVFFTKYNVRLEFESSDGYPGSSGNLFSQNGYLYLTNMRVVYMPSPPIPGTIALTIPLKNLLNGKLVRPWIGSNSYQGLVIPVPNGGLNDEGSIKLYFEKGGGFEFSSAYTMLRSRIAEDVVPFEEPLPLYSTEHGVSGPTYAPSGSSSQPNEGAFLYTTPTSGIPTAKPYQQSEQLPAFQQNPLRPDQENYDRKS
ncbi:hypothetical protein O5D80_001035 [Batrachochytrium dendrobatidis]|nr:hypothetical protein O5D80_001035 [Batrachochytrium dendrobatidis]